MVAWLQDVSTIADAVERVSKTQDLTTQGVLLVVIMFLIYAIIQYKKELKGKDERIREVVENHLNDIRKHSDDMISINKDTNKLIEELKKIYSNEKSA